RNGRHPERALLRLARLGVIDAPNVRRPIPLAVDGTEHGPDPLFEALLRPLHRLTVHPGGGMLRNLQKILQHPLARDVMRQRGEAEIWCPATSKISPRIASSKLLPNKLTAVGAVALANLVAGAHDGADQHGRAARTRG